MTFAFTDPLSNSGRLAPLYQLALLGEAPESFFSRAIFTYAHDNSIRAVADGLVDAAAVDSQVYEYLSLTEPDLVSKVKVVERWGPYGISPVAVNPNLDQELKARLREIFLGMDGNSQGRELLQRLLIDRFIVPDDSIYDSVREMRAYLREKGLTE
jgi:phosphonate transport system substrate-binding protein